MDVKFRKEACVISNHPGLYTAAAELKLTTEVSDFRQNISETECDTKKMHLFPKKYN